MEWEDANDYCEESYISQGVWLVLLSATVDRIISARQFARQNYGRGAIIDDYIAMEYKLMVLAQGFY